MTSFWRWVADVMHHCCCKSHHQDVQVQKEAAGSLSSMKAKLTSAAQAALLEGQQSGHGDVLHASLRLSNKGCRAYMLHLHTEDRRCFYFWDGLVGIAWCTVEYCN